MLEEEELAKLRKAGKIAGEVRRWVEGYVKEGMKVIDLCEGVEREIRRRGGSPAFPCNVDINEVGAHYTSPPSDPSLIPPGSIVKVDIGVHIDGYIADTAVSICFNPELYVLKQATDEALEAALEALAPGVKVSAIGAVIQKIIEKYGLKPVKNLTGHGLGRYKLHTGKPIPNVAGLDSLKIEEGEAYAVEPFSTTQQGAGEVGEAGFGHIFRILKMKPPKEEKARSLFEGIKNRFHTLPFAFRWVEEIWGKENLAAFSSLLKERHVTEYPLLAEKNRQPVAQSEHTVIVLKDEVQVLTL